MSKLTRDISARYRSREKQMVKDNIDNYMTATTEDYSQYMGGKSPSFVKYYQIDINATTMDENLLNMTDHVGADSPVMYNIINDFTLYIDSPITIQNEINEYGLISEIMGEALVLPDTIKPQVGDHFMFDLDENLGQINTVTFRITDVQNSGPTVKKFYRVQYELSDIEKHELDQKITEEFELEYDNVGSGDTKTIVRQVDHKLATACNVVADALITEFTDQYYDEDLDMFTVEHNDKYIWDAYLHTFIRNNAVLEYDEKKIMNEFYLMKLPEKEFKDYFSKKIYKKTLFKKLESKSRKTDPKYDILNIVKGELNETRLLPFFNSVTEYNYVTYGNYVPFGAFYPYIDEGNDTDILIAGPEPEDADEGDLWFRSDSSGVPIPLIKNEDDEWEDLSLSQRIKDYILFDEIDDNEFFLENIIIQYLNDDLLMDMKTLDEINDFDYEFEIKDYYLIPMLIYILRDTSKEILKP